MVTWLHVGAHPKTPHLPRPDSFFLLASFAPVVQVTADNPSRPERLFSIAEGGFRSLYCPTVHSLSLPIVISFLSGVLGLWNTSWETRNKDRLKHLMVLSSEHGFNHNSTLSYLERGRYICANSFLILIFGPAHAPRDILLVHSFASHSLRLAANWGK